MLFFHVIVMFAIQFDSLNEFKHPYWPQSSQKKLSWLNKVMDRQPKPTPENLQYLHYYLF